MLRSDPAHINCSSHPALLACLDLFRPAALSELPRMKTNKSCIAAAAQLDKEYEGEALQAKRAE